MNARITQKFQKGSPSSITIHVCPECDRHPELASSGPGFHAPTCSRPATVLRTYHAAPDQPTNDVLFSRVAERSGGRLVVGTDGSFVWLERVGRNEQFPVNV